MLNLLTFTEIGSTQTLQQRLDSLTILRAVLDNQDKIAALQFGYDNGDFFIIRPLNSTHMRQTFKAPDAADLVVDHVSTDANGKRHLLRIFFNDELQEVARNEAFPTEYDPRNRSWYLSGP